MLELEILKDMKIYLSDKIVDLETQPEIKISCLAHGLESEIQPETRIFSSDIMRDDTKILVQTISRSVTRLVILIRQERTIYLWEKVLGIRMQMEIIMCLSVCSADTRIAVEVAMRY